MKNIAKRLVLLLALGTGALNAMEATQCELPYLMLFVDINKTIIAEDKSKGLDPEESIAAILSDAPEYAYTWDNDGENMTYYAQLNKQYPGSDAAIKKNRESYQAKFIAAAQEHHHPMLKQINNEFNSLVTSLKTREPRKVFTSFSQLISYLRKKQYSFSIILRTFGQDLTWVSEELAQDGLIFTPGSFKKGILYLDNKVLKYPQDMIATFKPGINYAIQDNYDWWKESNFIEKGGKPFPIDISDKHVLSFFFDDNAADPVKPILHIIPVGQEKTNLHELIKMGRVVPADPRKAIADTNYFIDAIENALDKWRETFCK